MPHTCRSQYASGSAQLGGEPTFADAAGQCRGSAGSSRSPVREIGSVPEGPSYLADDLHCVSTNRVSDLQAAELGTEESEHARVELFVKGNAIEARRICGDLGYGLREGERTGYQEGEVPAI